MNQIRSLFVSIFVSGVLFFVPVIGFGQVAVEPSYEVSLQLLLGSNDAPSKANLPANLSTVLQHLKLNFGMSEYRLVNTSVGRVANMGNFDSLSVLNIGPQTAGQPQSLLQWVVFNLKGGMSAKGGNAFQVQSLRIQARVPFSTAVAKEDAAKDRDLVTYENFGFNLTKVGFQENVPVLIGTLNLPGSTETVFVVMTVKPVDL